MPSKLLDVHPILAARITQVIQAMAVLGYEMRVTDGVRTLEQQQALYAQGRTTPGPIVTKADGVKYPSNHQKKADGLGHAVDVTFWVGGMPSWADDLPWRCFGECCKARELKWGGDWAKPDKPHVEWESV